ncbi:murein L,D-transpeptidase YafK [Bradyrhizobium sp. i1.3.1]
MIGATALRALVLTAAFFATLSPATCLGENSNRLPAKATKELPPELLSLLRQKKMPKYSPILVRVFKQEAELEVWKQDTTGLFKILKVYPICRWSGDLGPKLKEGDRQAPEGFYTITPELMNPNSEYHLAINVGFPNSFDKANNRDGSLLMDPWRLLIERLLCHDRRTDKRDLFASAGLPRRPTVLSGPGLSIPPHAGKPGAASK